MKQNNFSFKDLFITISQILSIIYVFPMLFFAWLTITGIGPVGTYPVVIRFETILFTILGLLYFIFPVWLIRRRIQKKVPAWAQYLIFAMALPPILFFIFLIFLP